jgi:hypothetical protein
MPDNFNIVRQERTAGAMEILANNCVFPAFIGRENEKLFKGAIPIGDSLNMIRPIKTMGGTGQAFNPEGMIQTSVPLQIGFWVNFNYMFNSREEALFTDSDEHKTYVLPGIRHMAGTIDLLMAQYVAATSPNWVGTPGTPPTSTNTYASAQTKLNQLLAPENDRVVIFPSAFNQPLQQAYSTLFNPSQIIGKQDLTGKVGRHFDFDFMTDEQVPSITGGTWVTVGTVNGAGQQGSSIATSGWGAGTTNLLGQERFTYAGCYAVNPDSRLQTGSVLAQWQLTAPVSDVAGALTMQIFPTMITSGPYQNCSNSPANGAVITMAGTSGVSYTNAIAMQKGAYTAAFIELADVSDFGAKCVVMTDPDTKISIRCIWQWNSSGPYAGNVTFRAESIFGVASRYSEYFACAVLG